MLCLILEVLNFWTLTLGCGYPPLSVRATLRQLVDQLKLPAVGLFDYNVHCIQCTTTMHIKLLVATRGTDFAHLQVWIDTDGDGKSFLWYAVAYFVGIVNSLFRAGVDVKWLGLHCNDVLGPNTTVTASALQNWSPKDQQTFTAVMRLAEEHEHPHFVQELRSMSERRVKAEIESLNAETFDALETMIIQKILRKKYI